MGYGSFNSTGNMDAATSLFFGGFIIVVLLISIIMAILVSIGFYNMAKKDGMEDPWLMFIPVANLYLIGKMAKKGGCQIPNAEIVLSVGYVVIFIASFIPIVNILATIASIPFSGIMIYAYYCIYKRFSTNPVVSMIISYFVPFGIIFVLWGFGKRGPLDGGSSFSGNNGNGYNQNLYGNQGQNQGQWQNQDHQNAQQTQQEWDNQIQQNNNNWNN